MDPNACLEAMLNARPLDVDAYNEYKSDLIAWLKRGGFGPTVRHLDGRIGTLVNLTYTGDATVRWRNNRKTVVRVWDLGSAK